MIWQIDFIGINHKYLKIRSFIYNTWCHSELCCMSYSWIITTACFNISIWKLAPMIFNVSCFDSASLSIVYMYDYFKLSMNIDICSILVNLIISSFHWLKERMGALLCLSWCRDTSEDKKVFWINCKKKYLLSKFR